MNVVIETLNRFGEKALHFAWPMLWQSSVLIIVLFIIDFSLRRHVRAAVRYALWLVLLVKLLLPPALALPTGVAWWLLPAARPVNPHTTRFVVSYETDAALRLPPYPASTFTPPRPSISAAAWIVLTWSAISAGLLVWLAVRWRQVAGDVKHTVPGPAWLGELFHEAKASAGLRRNVRLRVTGRAMSPAVCGLFRPVILLPHSLVQQLPPAQLRAVLLHELTHLRRGDVWMNCAQALVQIVYWWHPLLWFANARIRRVREEAVDDAVMLALRDAAGTYAPTLLEVAKLAFHRPLASLGLVGILESRSALRQRIERLMDFRAPRKAGLTIASVLGILAFTALAIPMGAAPPHSSDLSDTAGSPATADNPPPSTGTDSEMAALETMTFKIDRPSDVDRLKKLLLEAGVKMPPTDYLYTENGLVLVVRGDPEQLALVNSAVLKLNRDLPKENVQRRRDNRDWLSMTNFVRGDARKVIFNKLSRIRFDQVSWPDGLPLTEVLRSLSEQTRLRDPDKTGINFTFQTNAPAASGIAVDANSIKIQLTLTDIRLADLLDAIVLVADHPIQYTILDDGIIFSARDSDSAPLETRTFKVDAYVITDSLRNIPGLATNSVSTIARSLFGKLGVDWESPKGKSVFFNDRHGMLYVKATESDLDTIERAIQVLSHGAPQIHIKARFVEVAQNDQTALGFDWYLGNVNMRNGNVIAHGGSAPSLNTPNSAANPLGAFPGNTAASPASDQLVSGGSRNPVPAVATITGILTDPNFRVVIHALEQNQGAEFLAEPEVTTTSGRQTQMRAIIIKDITTQYLASSDNSTVAPQYEKAEVGAVLDTIATVLPDGYTIDLTLIPSMTEFLGYDNSTNSILVATSASSNATVPTVLPRFRVRQTATQLKLWDGQTAVLGGLQGRLVPGGKEVAVKPGSEVHKQVLVFVTVTLVDPAGNRIHSDDEIAQKQHSTAGRP